MNCKQVQRNITQIKEALTRARDNRKLHKEVIDGSSPDLWVTEMIKLGFARVRRGRETEGAGFDRNYPEAENWTKWRAQGRIMD